ncbi:MAG: IclR family transcriptional regulator [Acetobacteraceae bacterium]|nr:IclR family transcriptional regulator [Acetobacteraceae bacterium]
MPGDPKNQVQSAAKVFAVLRAFDAETPELTISEVAGRAGLDRGTTFRLINTLKTLGYLAAVPRSRRFRLTLKCLELGYTALARGDLKTHARPLLQALVPEIADAGSLGMLEGPDVVYVERVQAELGMPNLDRRIGSRTKAYAAALGHAILAYLPREQQRAILESSERVKLSEKTIVELDALLERLALARERGYAIADGENAYGLRTVAAPVLDPAGDPVAGVSLTIRAERMELEPFATIAVPEVVRLAQELSQAVHLSFGAVAQPSRQRNIA